MADWVAHKDANQQRTAFLSRALAMLAVSHLAEVPLADLAPYVTDGSNDGGIDLVYFDANDKMLYLVQSKWHDDGRGSIDLGDMLKFIDGVRKLLDNDLDGLNERVHARQADIERALFDASAKFTLVVAHTGQDELGKPVAESLERYIDSQNDTSELMYTRVLAQADLHKAVAIGVAGAPITIELQMSGWGQVREPYHAIYGQVCASDVAGWMHAHGNRLFERNIRQFLGSSLVNQDIVSTLASGPEDFWYFNNGITAIASDVAKKPIGGQSTDNGIFECSGFCVVNGAQTVGSIHAAHLQDAEAVEKAMVPVRVISTSKSPDGYGSLVTRYTNTQNSIEKRDFVALDPNQDRLRQELHIEGIEYAFKAGKASTGSSDRRFDLVEGTLALACINSDVSLAVQAKREIGKLWEDLTKAPYRQLFHGGVTGPALWEAVQALRGIEKALQEEAKRHSGRDSLICVHGNRFIQWASFRRLGMDFGHPFAAFESETKRVVAEVVASTVGAVKGEFADSYPASLFKNLAKCRALANEVV
ncbi:AIPR family protein [Lysobacter sp. TAF61]